MIAGSEIDIIPNQLRIRSQLNFFYKRQDRFISNNKAWNNWMKEHNGYDSSHNRMGLVGELWFLNSISKYSFGPLPFDLYIGFDNGIITKNTFDGLQVYTGLTLSLIHI